jgi:hypothetical protein
MEQNGHASKGDPGRFTRARGGIIRFLSRPLYPGGGAAKSNCNPDTKAGPCARPGNPTRPRREDSFLTITQRDRYLGTAYAMKPASTRTELTSVARGTPMGELLRRYWHPVGLVSDATDTPKKVRVLG